MLLLIPGHACVRNLAGNMIKVRLLPHLSTQSTGFKKTSETINGRAAMIGEHSPNISSLSCASDATDCRSFVCSHLAPPEKWQLIVTCPCRRLPGRRWRRDLRQRLHPEPAEQGPPDLRHRHGPHHCRLPGAHHQGALPHRRGLATNHMRGCCTGCAPC
jgi:hypothetical protein